MDRVTSVYVLPVRGLHGILKLVSKKKDGDISVQVLSVGCIQKFKVTEISLSKSCSWDALAEYGIVLNCIEKV